MAEIDEVFEILGFGRMQKTIFVGCLLLQTWFTTEQLGLGIVMVAGACDLNMNDYKLAWVTALTFAVQIGAFVFWGILVDSMGRRKIIIFTGVTSNACSILSAGMPEFLSFSALRIICSAFIAAPVIAMMTYMGEFTKQSLRARVLNYLSYGLGISFILVPGTAYFILPLKIPNVQNWRILLLLNQIPGILGLAIISCMPESPKFYLSRHRQEDAMDVMERCCRMNKGKDTDLQSLGVQEITQPRLRALSTRKASAQFCLIVFRMFKEHTRILVISMLCTSVMGGIGFGLQVWMVRIRFSMKTDNFNNQTVCVHAAESMHADKQQCQLDRNHLEDPLIHGFLILGIFILTTFLLLCMGRRLIMLTYLAFSMLCNFSLNFLKEDLVIMFALFLMVDPHLGSMRLLQSLVIDTIPTHYRGKSAAMGQVGGRLGILFSSLFMGYTLTWNCYVAFNTFLVISLVAAILVSLLPSESKVMEMMR